MDYDTTSQLLDVTLQTAEGVGVEQLLFSNPPTFVKSSNKDATNLKKGTPVAVHSSGTGFVAATATSTGKAAFGLLAEDAAIGFAVTIMTKGTFVIEDWTQLIGSQYLQAKSFYFLSATTGLLTSISPTTPGQISQLIGEAVSPVALSVTMEPYILL